MATNVSVQHNGEPIPDIILMILARSNHLSTSGTYPPQDGIFWYELQLLLSEMKCFQCFLESGLHAAERTVWCTSYLPKPSKVSQNVFLPIGGLHKDN